MKINYSILTLLAFLLCSVAFASTGKDSLAVGKRTRTFATPPAASTITTTLPVKTRTFKSLDAQIAKNYEELKRKSLSEFTPRYFEELLATPVDSTEAVGTLIGQAKAVFEELRYKIQVLSIIASLPQLATNINGLDNIITDTDNAINNLTGITPNQKSGLINYFNSIKLNIPAGANELVRLQNILDSTNDGFDTLRSFYGTLSDTMKAVFIQDYARMSVQQLEEVMNTPRYFDGWQNFRNKYPSKFLCAE